MAIIPSGEPILIVLFYGDPFEGEHDYDCLLNGCASWGDGPVRLDDYHGYGEGYYRRGCGDDVYHSF